MILSSAVFADGEILQDSYISVGVEKDYALLNALKIYTYSENTDASSYVSREEFANVLASLIQIDESQKFEEIYFYDSGKGSIANTLASYGYLADWCPEFSKDKSVTVYEAAETFVKVLGYDASLGENARNKSEVRNQAVKLGLLKGTDAGGNLTHGQLVRMLGNTLDSKVCEIVSFSDSGISAKISSETFMELQFNTFYNTGTVYANLYTSIYVDVPVCGADQLTINGKTYMCDIEGSDEYIGREVKFYYTDDDDMPRIIYIETDENSGDITIQADDFAGYADGKIQYFEKNRKKDISVGSDTVYIINGQAYFAIPLSQLKDALNIKRGKITVCKNGGKVMCVNVENVVDAVVTGTDLSSGLIYADAFGVSVTLDTQDKTVVSIKDSAGKKIAVSNIAKNGVVSYIQSENKQYLKLVYTMESVEGKIEKIGKSGSNTIVGIGGKDYIVDSQYLETNTLKLGDSYVFRLDMYGRIAGAYKWKNSWNIAYLTGISIDKMGDSVDVRLCDASGGIKTLKLKKKVNMDGERITCSAAYEKLTSNGRVNRQLMRYFVSESDESIMSIDTAAASRDEREAENTLYLVAPLNERKCVADTEYPSSGYMRLDSVDGESTQGYLIDSTTIAFIIPQDTANDDASVYHKQAINYYENSFSYDAAVYKYNDSTPFADVCLNDTKVPTNPKKAAYMYMINDIYDSVYQEETKKCIEMISGLSSGVAGTYYFEDNIDVWSCMDNTIEYTVDANSIDRILGEGDIIQVHFAINGLIDGIRIIYDYSADSTFWGGTSGSYNSQSFSEWNSAASDSKFRVVYGDVYKKYEYYDNSNDRQYGVSVVTLSDADGNVMESYTMAVTYSRCTIYDPSRRENRAYYGRLHDIVDIQSGAPKCTKAIIQWSGSNPTSKFFYR